MTAARKDLGSWTVQNVLALPEDGARYELVDGALIMNPPPSPRHQDLSFRLHTMLRDAAHSVGAQVRIWEGVGVRLAGDQLLIPDLTVATSDLSKSSQLLIEPPAVRLVVEIVSPGSRTRDRTEKPYLYAEAGIPHFWRIETEDYRGRTKPLPLIITHELVGLGEYEVTRIVGAGEILSATEPIPIKLDPATLRVT
ncbi:MAG: Uma2 family endonuclease [Haloechinothrix sp.]